MYLMQACRFAFEKKLKQKKTQAISKLKQKTPKNSRKSSQNSNYRKFFLQHCILYFNEGKKGHFSRIFHPKTRIFCPKLNNSSENFKIFFEKLKDFCKNSRNFSKNSVYRKIYSPKLPQKVQNDKPAIASATGVH